jgi:hypothetical protein
MRETQARLPTAAIFPISRAGAFRKGANLEEKGCIKKSSTPRVAQKNIVTDLIDTDMYLAPRPLHPLHPFMLATRRGKKSNPARKDPGHFSGNRVRNFLRIPQAKKGIVIDI